MPPENKNLPDSEDVKRIVRRLFSEDVLTVERFPTGNCHFVFDVLTMNGKKMVVRLSRPENRHFLEGALFWHKLLKPKGIPIPEIPAFDLTDRFPFLVLERLPGKDLNFVYTALSKSEKKILARELTKIQKLVAELPQAPGFGYLESYETGSFCRSWTEVLQRSLERSRSRIKSGGIFDPEAVERVADKLRKYEDYLVNIEPVGFLDDITTKNVIIDAGQLSGIVDTDFICFGDNLLTVALTRMSLLLSNYELDYIEFWCDEMNLNNEQKKILDVYTALYAADFMGEFGQVFNKEKPLAVDNKRFERLNLILQSLLASI